MKAKPIIYLLILPFLFLFSGYSMGADKVDEAGWSHSTCFGYLYAMTKTHIKYIEVAKERSQCDASCFKNLKTSKENLAILDKWKSKLITHLGADANSFGKDGELSFGIYKIGLNLSLKINKGLQENQAKHSKGVGHCWSKVIIPTLHKLQTGKTEHEEPMAEAQRRQGNEMSMRQKKDKVKAINACLEKAAGTIYQQIAQGKCDFDPYASWPWQNNKDYTESNDTTDNDPTAFGDSDDDELVSLDTTDVKYASYFARIKHAIERVWIYPSDALQRGIGGDVSLKFRISKDGNLMGVHLVDKSGYEILDVAALKAVKEAAPFYPFPKNIQREKVSILANFVFAPY